MARPLETTSVGPNRPQPSSVEAAGVYARVTALIADELRAVEACFAEELRSDVPAVQALLKYVGRFRGKMLRPTLLLLTGKAVGGLTPQHVVLATVVEMVHMATLVHDDVLDEAELRRKGATINHLKGNEAAVMLGDLLISHAFYLCSSLDSQSASRQIGRTTNEICEGELLQIDRRNHLGLSEEEYLQIISKKTAALVATSCRLGAEYAGASRDVAAAMDRFGRNLGVAFQIQDDVLDLVGDVREVGKTLGIDVDKGKLTLPLIHFLRTAPPEHRELLRSLMCSKDADKVEKIRNLILPSGSMEYARRRAESLVSEARDCLKVLPPSPAREALDACADFVVHRGV